MNWYPRFPGDYMRDTAHLSLTEHGAYNVLLDHYYATCRPLPDNHEALIRICRAYADHEKLAVRTVANEFFPVNGDGMRHNRRADEELSKADERSEKARQSAAFRWDTKRNADAMRTHKRTQCSPHPHPHPESTTKEKKPPNPLKGGVVLPFKSEAFKDAWQSFLEHRAKLRSPMTDRAQELNLKRLPESEAQAIRWVNTAIERGWKGIFEPQPDASRPGRPLQQLANHYQDPIPDLAMRKAF